MPLIQTSGLRQEALDPEILHQVYCGLDSMLTLEILSKIKSDHGERSPEPIYGFERALQAPLLEMSLRGFRIDGIERHRRELEIRLEITEAQGVLDELAQAVWAKPLNPRSYQQLQDFFYKTLQIPAVVLSFKGERKVSTNREALEKIDQYLYARPFVSLILQIRDLGKQLSVLTEEIDSDGRHRTSYNIGGTETGRLSSSTSVLGTGGNAQNIAPELRRVFISDPGWKLCSIDLEQVEARDVGWLCGTLFGDWTLLDSCEAGDLHTKNAMLCWPKLPWPGVASQDRALAERTPLYREWSLRDGTKRMGHLSNYIGTAWMISRVLKVPIRVAEEFQRRYLLAYPALPRYWQWVGQKLQTEGMLHTPFGRTRHFFGDPRSDSTLREAVAFIPQSMTGDRTNFWLWKVWARLGNRVQLLAQTHDSITFQFWEEDSIDEIISRILELLSEIKFYHKDRVYQTPGEAKVGWNWAPWSEANPEGLKKWKSGVADQRIRKNGLERLHQ